MIPPLEQSLRAETVIGHPPIEIWRAFTRPEHLRYWFGEAVEIDLRVGGTYVVRGTCGIRLDTTIEKLHEGRRLVLRPTRRGDDARIELDIHKLSGSETRVWVADPDQENSASWQEALDNLHSVWEKGIDLREARVAVMGVGPSDIDPGERPISGVPADIGVRLGAVLASRAAEKAGLRPGDILVTFDGAPVRSGADLVARIRACRPGLVVAVEAVRDGEPVTTSVTMGSRSGRGEPPPSPQRLLRLLQGSAQEADSRLETAVEGVADDDAYRPESPGKWSVAQVLAHLSLTERMLQCWLDEAARGGPPSIEEASCTGAGRIAGVLAGRPKVGELLARIRRDEVETLAYLAEIPTEVIAFKPRWGRLAFTALDFHAHSEDHLGQIDRIRKTLRI